MGRLILILTFSIIMLFFIKLISKKEKIKTESKFFENNKEICTLKSEIYRWAKILSIFGFLLCVIMFLGFTLSSEKKNVSGYILSTSVLLFSTLCVLVLYNFKIVMYEDYFKYYTAFKNVYIIEYKDVLKLDIWNGVFILKTKNKHFMIARSSENFDPFMRRLNKHVIHDRTF